MSVSSPVTSVSNCEKEKKKLVANGGLVRRIQPLRRQWRRQVRAKSSDHLPRGVQEVGGLVHGQQEPDTFYFRGYGSDPFDDRNAMQYGGE
jgi:hypothetical protein